MSSVTTRISSNPQLLAFRTRCLASALWLISFYAQARKADAAAFRAYCAERLSDYKVPEIIHLRSDPLPRNQNGKVMKPALRGCLQAPARSRLNFAAVAGHMHDPASRFAGR